MSSFIRRACAVVVGAFVPLFVAISLTSGEARADTLPGAIPARFSVSDQGAATYVIPIEAPAATGGIRPSLALSYNHLAGLGIAGVGWNLSGISAISRCSRTYAQDGLFAGYTYSGSTDRYCLDGQRLVAYSGTYGASGTEYRTELETFQRVFQQGTVGSTGAEAFYVKHGDGTVSYYGYTSDSRIEAVNISGVRAWYRSYTEDQFGNRINYVYSENTSTGRFSSPR